MDEARYDRQLRLWGIEGQRKLSSSTVICFGSCATAVETLKNLVLPGIGSFVVVDDATVCEVDFGTNFFLERSDLGRFRADAVVERLVELNPSLSGRGRSITNVHQLGIPQGESKMVCIVVNDWIHNLQIVDFIQRCCHYVVTVESIGFIGRVSLHGQHVALEPRSDEGGVLDLKIRSPWPILDSFIESFDFSSQADLAQLYHIPWLIILAKAYKGGGRTRAELLSEISRLEAGRADGLNFQEARDNIFMLTAVRSEDQTVKSLQENLNILQDEFQRPDELVIGAIAGVLEFYKRNHQLPLSTSSLPDMTSDTKSYTRLVDIFRSKFDADVKEVASYAPEDVPDEIVRKVVANHGDLNVLVFPLVFSNLDDSVSSPTPKRRIEESSPLCFDDDPDHGVLVKLLDGESVDPEHELTKEFKRYASSTELHCISSVVGSVAAQEIVKLVTSQFLPIDNVFVFNGINGTAFTYRK